jgi:protein-tyrosine-phosphatase
MPARVVNPLVVEVMREKGIDISHNEPKLLNTQMIQDADMVIVMGCSVGVSCPAPLLSKVVDWGVEDPKGEPIEKIREIRDEIGRRVRKLVDETI